MNRIENVLNKCSSIRKIYGLLSVNDQNEKVHAQLNREDLLALCVKSHWERFVDPQNMCYYMMCTVDPELGAEDESSVPAICSFANRYAKKLCLDYVYSIDNDKQLIIELTKDYEAYYLGA